MSADAVAYVYKYSPYDGATQLVLLALADVVNDERGNVYYGAHATLAAKARVTRRTAQRALSKLMDDGWLKAVRRQGVDQCGGTNCYEFIADENRPVVYQGRDYSNIQSDGRTKRRPQDSDVRQDDAPSESVDVRHHDAPSEAVAVDVRHSDAPSLDTDVRQGVAPSSERATLTTRTCDIDDTNVRHHDALTQENSIELKEGRERGAPATPPPLAPAPASASSARQTKPTPDKAKAKAREAPPPELFGYTLTTRGGVTVSGRTQADTLFRFHAVLTGRDPDVEQTGPQRGLLNRALNPNSGRTLESCSHYIEGAALSGFAPDRFSLGWVFRSIGKTGFDDSHLDVLEEIWERGGPAPRRSGGGGRLRLATSEEHERAAVENDARSMRNRFMREAFKQAQAEFPEGDRATWAEMARDRAEREFADWQAAQ